MPGVWLLASGRRSAATTIDEVVAPRSVMLNAPGYRPIGSAIDTAIPELPSPHEAEGLQKESGPAIAIICTGSDMDSSKIIARLRDQEAELKAAGIVRLSLHGSYARGTAIIGASDVDIIADFDRDRRFSLIGRVHLENRLTDILGVKADLADRTMLRSEVLEEAHRESVLVF